MSERTGEMEALGLFISAVHAVAPDKVVSELTAAQRADVAEVLARMVRERTNGNGSALTDPGTRRH